MPHLVVLSLESLNQKASGVLSEQVEVTGICGATMFLGCLAYLAKCLFLLGAEPATSCSFGDNKVNVIRCLEKAY